MIDQLIDKEAEQYLLGILLNQENSFFKIPYISKEYFYFLEHQEIFELIASERRNDNACNLVTLRAKLPHLTSQLMICMAKGAGAYNIAEYANLVQELYQKRELLKAFEDLQKKVLDPKISPVELVEQGNKYFNFIHQNVSEYRSFTYGQVVKDVAQDLKNKRVTTSTGFARMDYTMNGGLEAGRFYGLAAKPKAGKTLMKGTIANHLRKNHIPFLFVAAEMGRKGITRRLVSAEVGSNLKEFYTDSKVHNYLLNYKSEKETMYFVDSPRISLDALKSVVTNAVQTKGIQGFILDYLQLVTGSNKNETISQHQENVAQSIAELCKRLNIWCLASCQINRENEVRNGDGILMAVDWLYEIKNVNEETGDLILKHIASRDMRPVDIGSETMPAYRINQGVEILEYAR